MLNSEFSKYSALPETGALSNRGSPKTGATQKKLGPTPYELLSETGARFSIFVLFRMIVIRHTIVICARL